MQVQALGSAALIAVVGRARDFVELARPKHWTKNVVVFAGPAAGLKLFTEEGLVRSLLVFLAFCLAASATYAINDTLDREADMRHPSKRNRPVARGAIAPSSALVFGALLFAGALLLSFGVLNRAVGLVVLCYFVLTFAYSIDLKRRVILDVIVIAMGFVLRAWAGALAVGVPTSLWLVACMFTLCLFMGFGKRRCEVISIGNADEAGKHRRTLLHYTPEFLNHLLTVSAAIAVITFLLYTVDRSHPAPFNKEQLFYTLPIVIYGTFRFALASGSGLYAGPTEIVLRDAGIRAAVLVWALLAFVVAYQEQLLGSGGLARLLAVS